MGAMESSLTSEAGEVALGGRVEEGHLRRVLAWKPAVRKRGPKIPFGAEPDAEVRVVHGRRRRARPPYHRLVPPSALSPPGGLGRGLGFLEAPPNVASCSKEIKCTPPHMLAGSLQKVRASPRRDQNIGVGNLEHLQPSPDEASRTPFCHPDKRN
jgi:hypothetical protein